MNPMDFLMQLMGGGLTPGAMERAVGNAAMQADPASFLQGIETAGNPAMGLLPPMQQPGAGMDMMANPFQTGGMPGAGTPDAANPFRGMNFGAQPSGMQLGNAGPTAEGMFPGGAGGGAPGVGGGNPEDALRAFLMMQKLQGPGQQQRPPVNPGRPTPTGSASPAQPVGAVPMPGPRPGLPGLSSYLRR